jgi:hypothetical protein
MIYEYLWWYLLMGLQVTGEGSKDTNASYQKQIAFGDLFSWFLLLSCVVDVIVTVSRFTKRPNGRPCM